MKELTQLEVEFKVRRIVINNTMPSLLYVYEKLGMNYVDFILNNGGRKEFAFLMKLNSHIGKRSSEYKSSIDVYDKACQELLDSGVGFTQLRNEMNNRFDCNIVAVYHSNKWASYNEITFDDAVRLVGELGVDGLAPPINKIREGDNKALARFINYYKNYDEVCEAAGLVRRETKKRVRKAGYKPIRGKTYSDDEIVSILQKYSSNGKMPTIKYLKSQTDYGYNLYTFMNKNGGLEHYAELSGLEYNRSNRGRRESIVKVEMNFEYVKKIILEASDGVWMPTYAIIQKQKQAYDIVKFISDYELIKFASDIGLQLTDKQMSVSRRQRGRIKPKTTITIEIPDTSQCQFPVHTNRIHKSLAKKINNGSIKLQ